MLESPRTAGDKAGATLLLDAGMGKTVNTTSGKWR